MQNIRDSIRTIVADIVPYDALETAHRQEVLDWIDSGSLLFRAAKPDVPPTHLVSYFVLFDEANKQLFLIDHFKAKAWLPTGGHVDLNEHPRDTVVREAQEELSTQAKFSERFGDKPLFVTVTDTNGAGRHTDVSLWYVLDADMHKTFNHDGSEFSNYKWMSLDDVLAMDIQKLDKQMHRFVAKLQSAL